ncbi:hypothetical protein Pan153_02410 [Gimesia panareensis]|uniref:Uncharacterized protein n=1 Tax=Gimesia panareensis TaxID=2527978 RepID=A0A518FH08_9PLAN|nr:hypothetical protein [Gimesia panareensis]QDV15625.1 hypothetical protein Pan153_02410 [Gimesia panareensis]
MSKDAIDLILAEYSALRSEIEKRCEMRYRLVSYTIVLLGTMIALVFRSDDPQPIVLFLFPVFACLLSSLWVHNFRMTMIIASYIIERVEPAFGHDGWEKFVAEASKKSGMFLINNTFSTAAIFIFTQVTALLCGLSVKIQSSSAGLSELHSLSALEWGWFAIGCIAVVATVLIHRMPAKYENRDFHVSRIRTSDVSPN